ncbi:MAG: hypothetical protein IPI67_24930 [Myxococcales bacterium]|nr:hypothetical protein [Myxococcales bacterium]
MRFFQVLLRTSDVDAARAFYATVLGDCVLDVVPLHEQAVARGARPHWLGFLDVGDVDRAAAAFAERGATALGPTWVNPEGLKAAVMRDPGGAVIALAQPAERSAQDIASASTGPDVVWYMLHTADVVRAKANYGELFGWEFAAAVDLGTSGVFHPFACERGGIAVGSMTDVETRTDVHPHWQFQLRVPGVDRAMDAVRHNGGVVLGPFTTERGDRIAVCEDPQGAAFAIRE